MWYDYFMLIINIWEDFPQNDDSVSRATGVTGINGPSFITQDRRSDLPKLFRHTVDKAATESKRKSLFSALYHLQDYMEAIKQDAIKQENLTYDHMNHLFL